MKIIDTTSNKVLAYNARWADTFLKRLAGLMLKKDMSKTDGLILAPCSSIHTHFMRFSINVLVLDRSRTVMKQAFLQPWKMLSQVKGGYYIIELPEDSHIKDVDLTGHRIKIEE